MHPTESDGTREPHTTPQAFAGEMVPEGPPGWRVVVAMNPVRRRRFCAAMYNYCLTPQYWEVF